MFTYTIIMSNYFYLKKNNNKTTNRLPSRIIDIIFFLHKPEVSYASCNTYIFIFCPLERN